MKSRAPSAGPLRANACAPRPATPAWSILGGLGPLLLEVIAALASGGPADLLPDAHLQCPLHEVVEREWGGEFALGA